MNFEGLGFLGFFLYVCRFICMILRPHYDCNALCFGGKFLLTQVSCYNFFIFPGIQTP